MNPDGSRILLEDMAAVTEGFEESDSWASFNGKRAILLSVYRVGEQTPFQVASAAREVIDEIRSSLPQGMGIELVRDMSKIFIQRADLLLSNAYIGLALVFIVLALFLEIRLAFWVSLGIPVSFLGSFLLLAPTNFTIKLLPGQGIFPYPGGCHGNQSHCNACHLQCDYQYGSVSAHFVSSRDHGKNV